MSDEVQDEYKILYGTTEYVQKVLNQWRHEYWLNIVVCQSYISHEHSDSGEVMAFVMLLRRLK